MHSSKANRCVSKRGAPYQTIADSSKAQEWGNYKISCPSMPIESALNEAGGLDERLMDAFACNRDLASALN